MGSTPCTVRLPYVRHCNLPDLTLRVLVALAGDSYVCVKNAKFYDLTNTSNFASNFYNQPGGDVWDVQNSNTTSEWLGTCMCVARNPNLDQTEAHSMRAQLP